MMTIGEIYLTMAKQNALIEAFKSDRKQLLEAVANTIGEDIMWHEQNTDKALTSDYHKGFISGLIQARYLVGEISRKLEQDD